MSCQRWSSNAQKSQELYATPSISTCKVTLPGRESCRDRAATGHGCPTDTCETSADPDASSSPEADVSFQSTAPDNDAYVDTASSASRYAPVANVRRCAEHSNTVEALNRRNSSAETLPFSSQNTSSTPFSAVPCPGKSVKLSICTPD